jgi:hypothetical protein
MAPSLSLYDTTIPGLIRTLKKLSGILSKGTTFAAEQSLPETDLTSARLAPDMYPLATQVLTATNAAKLLAVRVANIPNEPWEDTEQTFEELQARITKTVAFLERVKREDFEGAEEREFEFYHLTFTGLRYVVEYGLPNFYFHVVTAYDILRMKGVQVGKLDFLGP